MRIKIIGENNCARATRHLLRLAGFAVTEFLPLDAVTSGLHAGYAITIDVAQPDSGAVPPHAHYASQAVHDLAPATPSPDSRLRSPDNAADEGGAHPRPDSPTHHHASAREEAPRSHRDASSPAPSRTGFSLSGLAAKGGSGFTGEEAAGAFVSASIDAAHAAPARDDRLPLASLRGKKPVLLGGSIHFDSVESALEAAVLRHVTQLASAPVIVDRPGGVVHSDRELRIIAPSTGDARADEAAAVAIEFGVLRGLLDLTAPGAGKSGTIFSLSGLPQGEKTPASHEHSSEHPSDRPGKRRMKKWWLFGIALLALCGAGVSPAGWPRTGNAKTAGPSVVGASEMRAPALAAAVSSGFTRAPSGKSALLPIATLISGFMETDRLKPVLLAEEPAQGQFATGQAIDPCKAQAKSYASISQTANAQLVAGAASKKIYVCSIHVVVAAAANVAVVEGTGTICGTGTSGVGGFGGATAATGWNFAANGGIALGNGDSSLGAEVTSGDSLCILNSGSGQVSGGISYVVQ